MVLGIYGAGGLGREVLELARIVDNNEKRWDEIIFIDKKFADKEAGEKVNDACGYAYEEALEKYNGNLEVTIAVGEPQTREKLFASLEKDNVQLATIIHPDVHIPSTTAVGKGVTIQANTFISCNVIVEDYVYIQPNVNIGHDDTLKKGCMISGLCNLAGNVTIGEFTYLGMSAVCKEGIAVGDYSIIGMGSVVHKDIPSEMIAMGNPARPMKQNEDRHVFR